MAKDEEKTETTETKTDRENFASEMDKVLTDTAPKGDQKAPEGGDKTVSDETIKEDEILETGGAPEETVETEEAELSAEETELIEDIDPEVIEVCREYGWDDKKIVQIAKLSPELLEDVRDVLDEEQTEEPQKQPARDTTETKKPEPDEFKIELDPDVVGPEMKKAVDMIVDKLNQQSKGLSEEQKNLKAEKDAAFNNRIETCFDRQSKIIMAEAKKTGPKNFILDLGDSSRRLTKPQYMRRIEIFRHAQITADLKRVSMERAIEIEIKKAKNQDSEKTAGQRILDKLERQKRHFTSSPTRRHLNLTTRKFATEEEEKEAIMSEAYKEANIED